MQNGCKKDSIDKTFTIIIVVLDSGMCLGVLDGRGCSKIVWNIPLYRSPKSPFYDRTVLDWLVLHQK